MHLYILQAGNEKAGSTSYKISVGDNLVEYYSNAQANNHETIWPIANRVFTDSAEAYKCLRALHQRLKAKRIRGDWFSLTTEELWDTVVFLYSLTAKEKLVLSSL